MTRPLDRDCTLGIDLALPESNLHFGPISARKVGPTCKIDAVDARSTQRAQDRCRRRKINAAAARPTSQPRGQIKPACDMRLRAILEAAPKSLCKKLSQLSPLVYRHRLFRNQHHKVRVAIQYKKSLSSYTADTMRHSSLSESAPPTTRSLTHSSLRLTSRNLSWSGADLYCR